MMNTYQLKTQVLNIGPSLKTQTQAVAVTVLAVYWLRGCLLLAGSKMALLQGLNQHLGFVWGLGEFWTWFCFQRSTIWAVFPREYFSGSQSQEMDHEDQVSTTGKFGKFCTPYPPARNSWFTWLWWSVLRHLALKGTAVLLFNADFPKFIWL